MIKSALVLLAASAVIGSVSYASRPTLEPMDVAQLKIDSFVMRAIETDPNAIPILIRMQAQADLSGIETAHLPREERLTRVYDALRNVALDTQGDLVTFLEKNSVTYRRFYITNMIAVWGANARLVKQLARRSDVSHIYGNPTIKTKNPNDSTEIEDLVNEIANLSPRRVRKAEVRSKSEPVVGDNISFTRADQIWKTYGKAGEGIVVAGQDTGVEFDHPALVRQYRGNEHGTFSHDYNWHDSIHAATPMRSIQKDANRCGYDLKTPCDDGDHGSHTMGTMLGSDGKRNTVGMAPNAKWIACRNMDGGDGTPAAYIECFEWLLAPYAFGADPMRDGNPTKAPHIINNSWSCPSKEGCSKGAEIEPALQAMKAAGIMVVVSAGNEGPSCGTIEDAPAWHTDLVLSVGAYDHRMGKIAIFSSRGPSQLNGKIGPDLVAPGVGIRSSIPGKKFEGGPLWQGTSMAGPHVAGAVALLWSIHPELIGEIEITKELLRQSATPTEADEICGGVPGSAVPNNTYGMGVMNIAKAIQAADVKGSKPGPIVPLPKPRDTTAKTVPALVPAKSAVKSHGPSPIPRSREKLKASQWPEPRKGQ